MNLAKRISFLLDQRQTLQPWVGSYDKDSLINLLNSELGDYRRLEEWIDGSKVTLRSPVLHVVSENTEHAAFQTVFRAILVGSESWIKIPSSGLPNFEKWAGKFDFLTLNRELPETWKQPSVAIIYGGAETINFFRNWLSPKTRIIEHGPKITAAFVFKANTETCVNLAKDIMSYGQRGCLSVQMIYAKDDLLDFCESLAVSLNSFPKKNQASLSEAGAVRNEREIVRFRKANGSKLELWESKNSVDWTIVMDDENTELRPGPLSGFVRVCQMPKAITALSLGRDIEFLSTAVVEPISEAPRLEKIAPQRICSAGKSQEPGIFWHPDGEMPLASLVQWRDLG